LAQAELRPGAVGPLNRDTLRPMMDKFLEILELPKVLESLASVAAFSASKELARNLSPATDLSLVQRMQSETSEACMLLSKSPALTIGGARDVRADVETTVRGAVLESDVFLDIKNTLLAGRTIGRLARNTRQCQKSPLGSNRAKIWLMLSTPRLTRVAR